MKRAILALLVTMLLGNTGQLISTAAKGDVDVRETVSSEELKKEKEFAGKMFASKIKARHVKDCVIQSKQYTFY